MDQISEQVYALAKNADESTRKQILDGLRDIAYSIETPLDTMHRLTFSNLEIVMIKVGIDLDLFTMLSNSESPLTITTIAERTKVDPPLLGRILRYLASVAIIKEAGKDLFTASPVTKTLAIPGMASGIIHYFTFAGPSWQVLPGFLAETEWQEPKDPLNCPLTKGHNTDLPAFLFAPTKPDAFAHFNTWMSVQRTGMPVWLDKYSIQEKVANVPFQPEQPLFVDIGGGMGHQSLAFRERHPGLAGRVIVQDIPPTLATAPKHDNVEQMVYDFWTPQPVQGARFYYLRNILHDYPDEACEKILRNTIPALKKDYSTILIDDMVLPDQGVHWHATQLDMWMMAGMSAKERTREQWQNLIARIGLKIVGIYEYTSSLKDSIIELELP